MSSSVIEIIKKEISIVSKIGQYVRLINKGAHYSGLCPFHKEKTPSFTVSEQKKMYYCFGCGAKGDILTFLQHVQNKEFKQILHELAHECGLSFDKQTDPNIHLKMILKKLVQACQQDLFRNTKAMEYLNSRGININWFDKYLLGFVGVQALAVINECTTEDRKQLGIGNHLANRIFFPIVFEKEIVGFGARQLDEDTRYAKYINSSDSAFFQKRCLLYGYDFIDKAASLVLVEGYLDVILTNELTEYNAVAALGTAFSLQQFELITKKVKQLIMCFDGDTAGQKATLRTIEIILPNINSNFVLKVCMLEEQDDPASLILENASKFKLQIDNSLALSEFLYEKEVQQLQSNYNAEGLLQVRQALKNWLDKITNGNVKRMFSASWSAGIKEYMKTLPAQKQQYKFSVPKAQIFEDHILMLFGLLCEHAFLIDDMLDEILSLKIEYLSNAKQSLFIKAQDVFLGNKDNEDVLVQIKQLWKSNKRSSALPQDKEQIKQLWIEIYHQCLVQQYKTELTQLQKRFQEHFQEEDWQRIIELNKMLQQTEK